MAAAFVDEYGIFRCAEDRLHRLLTWRTAGVIRVGCTDCRQAGWDDVASVAWYDDHRNLSLLLDWLGDMSPSGFRGVVEKPWKWETEYRAAVAAGAHEAATGHAVLKDGISDVDAYCNEEACDWRVADGKSNDAVLAVSS